MPRLPARFAGLIIAFAPLFVHRSWKHAQVLLTGALLAPGQRMVASLLRIAGLSRERHFVNYHRVLSRAAWSPRSGGRILLGLIVEAFLPDGPLVIAVDDIIERRRWLIDCQLGLQGTGCPTELAVACTSPVSFSAGGLCGFTSMAIGRREVPAHAEGQTASPSATGRTRRVKFHKAAYTQLVQFSAFV